MVCTLRWLDATFARAGLEHARDIVIGLQADMWDLEKGAGHLIVVEGSGMGTHWLRLSIEPRGRSVFSWPNIAY